jgi:uncharacterized protein involved in tolerance to divalent cations
MRELNSKEIIRVIKTIASCKTTDHYTSTFNWIKNIEKNYEIKDEHKKLIMESIFIQNNNIKLTNK